MTNNGREVLRVAPARDLRERAFQLFGAGLLESLLPVEGGREYVARVSGFVSAPRERRTTRDAQYFFVNKRFVRDRTIAGGLLEGFRSVLPHGVYPVAFLFLDIPLEEIDVNVHPAKTEIRFRRGEAVKDVIAEAIRSSLVKAGITGDGNAPEAEIEHTGPAAPRPPQAEQPRIELLSDESAAPLAPAIETNHPKTARSHVAAAGGYSGGAPDSPAQTPVDFLVADISVPDSRQTASGYAELPPVDSAARISKPIEVKDLSAAKILPLGQLHESFIIAVDDEGLLLIDQHVAHERILFDKYRKMETDREIESQNLLLPETIDLSPAQSEAFQLIENDLEQLGFGVMRLSGRTVAIKSIPTDLAPSEARNLFAEILDTIELEKRGAPKSTLRADIAASLACKAAIKINMKLTPEKMRWLIDRLLITTSPTTCPHGRPIILRLSMKDIERGFHRT